MRWHIFSKLDIFYENGSVSFGGLEVPKGSGSVFLEVVCLLGTWFIRWSSFEKVEHDWQSNLPSFQKRRPNLAQHIEKENNSQDAAQLGIIRQQQNDATELYKMSNMFLSKSDIMA